jgi:RNase P/RNase MRP subunit p29
VNGGRIVPIRTDLRTSFDRAVRERLAGEILGSPITIDRAPGLAHLPITGRLRDETLGTLRVALPGRDRSLCVPKTGLEARLLLEGREISLRGEDLRMRPEDRTKRLLLGGSRRSP